MSESAKSSRNNLCLFIGTAFGLGLSPVMPGSFGALLGVVFHVSIVLFLPSDYHLPLLIVVFLSVCTANHILFPWAKEYWHNPDSEHFVLDEAAGYLFVPILFRQGELWPVVIWGFILFRFFDMIKMPIARQIDQKMHNAWGVILDDIVSAIYAVVTMFILSWVGPFTIGNIIIPVP